jgi:hypothetical protein
MLVVKSFHATIYRSHVARQVSNTTIHRSHVVRQVSNSTIMDVPVA